MDRVFDHDSGLGKVAALELSSRVGRAMMTLLSRAPMTASHLAREMGIPLPTVLFHLSRLEMAGIVKARVGLGKRLREVKYYSVQSPQIVFRIGGETNGGTEKGAYGERRDNQPVEGDRGRD